MKSQLLGWNKQQVDSFIQEKLSQNEQQIRIDSEKLNQIYADLSAVHREMLEASQELVLAREQSKKLEDIEKVAFIMKDNLVKEAEDKARDMIASAYEEAQLHRQEIEIIRTQIKTLSNEYKILVNQIEDRMGLQFSQQNQAINKDIINNSAIAATRDTMRETENELEVIGGLASNKVINFIRPFQSGSQKSVDSVLLPDATPFTPPLISPIAEPYSSLSNPDTSQEVTMSNNTVPPRTDYIPSGMLSSTSINSVEMPMQHGLDEKQSLYIIGNLAGTDLSDDEGQIIVSKGNKITPDIVNRAFVAGRLIDLVVNMELPGFDESQ